MAKSGAAFMQIMNMTDTDDRLVAATASVAKRVELHTHIESDDGVMLMREVEGGFEIAAGQGRMLARGGDHVMLMGLTQKVMDGDIIHFTLTFEQAGDVEIDIPVDLERKGTGQMQHGTHGNAMSDATKNDG